MLTNDKIMFDRYYCINSTKLSKMKKILVHYIYNLITFSYASKLCMIRAALSTHNLACALRDAW